MDEVGLVGLGAIGAGAHLQALLRSKRLRLVAVAEPDPVRRAAVALPDRVARRQTLEELLGEDSIRGVVLATPPWVTPGLVVAAARAGRFVLAEKPIATDPTAAGSYDRLSADEMGRIQVGLTYRHDPAIRRLREMITDGELGGPLLVRAHIYDEVRTDDAGHADLIERTLAAGPPVIHEGAHVLDWLAYLLDAEPTVRDAWSLRTRQDLPADNLIGARLGFGEHLALVEFGWLTDGLPRVELTLTGDRGTAVLDGQTFAISLTTRAGSEPITFAGDRSSRCFDLQLERFADLICGGRAEPDLAAGRAALRWSAAIATAAKERS
ncbi:Gfo/Idh/MocA family protein [Microlunatus soli]|uniref:Predicted dehydrogenase n=1 Tax=Microlunatus soli TaxID=630515 RepID=A0A1H1Z2N5_9ACTN|nr:Gfo/Idh/MocA family oxidoreductase [Microlunatus soli]SDT27446.1 Predicted dehydrogenase [Microlunatus soli]